MYSRNQIESARSLLRESDWEWYHFCSDISPQSDHLYYCISLYLTEISSTRLQPQERTITEKYIS